MFESTKIDQFIIIMYWIIIYYFT